MSRQITTTIDIAAAPEAVWMELTDFAAFEWWNPFMIHAEGRAAVGERLVVRLRPEGGRAVTFKPTVLAADYAKELRWLGRFVVGGVFDGEHSFTLAANADGTTRLTQSETFRGVLVPFTASMLKGTEAGFTALNRALKERVESARIIEES